MGNNNLGVKTSLSALKIALIGYGKMGRAIEEIAQGRNIEIVAKIDSLTPFKDITLTHKYQADIFIDFSHPQAVLEHVKQSAYLGKNLVVGTTGWYEHLPQVKKIVESSDIGLIYSPNFSIGVNLFFKIVEESARLVASFEEYDIAGIEKHHRVKLDIPSGTALALGDILTKNIPRKEKVIFGDKKIKDPLKEIAFPSIRSGSFPGTHEIYFDSDEDTISLSIASRNRLGFAKGAILAAEWIRNKKGFFTLDDMLKAFLEKKNENS
jgi:4-hydroxy-tetrahydrodipicolinate reductase